VFEGHCHYLLVPRGGADSCRVIPLGILKASTLLL